jgi:hypothetical protein
MIQSDNYPLAWHHLASSSPSGLPPGQLKEKWPQTISYIDFGA